MDITPNPKSSFSLPPPKFGTAIDIDVEHTRDAGSSSGHTQHKSPPTGRSMELRRLIAAVSAALSSKPIAHWVLLLLSTILTFTSLVASSVLPRSYYRYGSSLSFWVISWFTTAGWPLAFLLLLPFLLSPSRPFFTPALLFRYALLGLLTAVANSIFAGICEIPWRWEMRGGTEGTPISSFHGATTAAFGTLLGRWIAENKVGAWKVNAAFVAAVGALAVAFEFSRKEENAASNFFIAILLLDVPVSALRGLVLALTERIVRRRTRDGGVEGAATPWVTVRAALEVQAMVSLFAFAFSSIGFFVNGGFGKVRRDGKSFEGGERSYYMILAWSAVAFQLLSVGGATLAGLSSTTFAGLLGSVRLPVTSLLAMAFFPDPMSALKVLGVVLGVWGVGCYGFGNLGL